LFDFLLVAPFAEDSLASLGLKRVAVQHQVSMATVSNEFPGIAKDRDQDNNLSK
jgi:hypothetical protein